MVRTSKRRRIIQEAIEAIEDITLHCLSSRALSDSDDDVATMQSLANASLPYFLCDESDSNDDLQAARTASKFFVEIKKRRNLEAPMPLPRGKSIVEDLGYLAEFGNRHQFRGIVRTGSAAFDEFVQLAAAVTILEMPATRAHL